MANEANHVGLSPTVLHVMERFANALRADGEIPDDAIDRLEGLLRTGAIPDPGQLNTALFDPPPDG
jgi:hypothetical protein